MLVVDDTAEVRRFVKLLLGSKGLTVVAAESGQRALDALAEAQAGGAPFDAVLADYMMPMSGTELLSAVVSRFPGLPVFVYSAAMDARLQSELTRAGARGVFDKEVVSAGGIRMLVAALEEVRGDRRAKPSALEACVAGARADTSCAAGAEDVARLGAATLGALRTEAQRIGDAMRESPDPRADLPRFAERLRDLYVRARADCERLLRARSAAGQSDPDDGRRIKHLVLERIGNSAAILETAIAEIGADPTQGDGLARTSFVDAEDMLAHLLDMLGAIERTWGVYAGRDNGTAG